MTRRGDFNTFFHEAARTGVFKSVRDLYEDTRPKLEYGTLVDSSTGKHGRSRAKIAKAIRAWRASFAAEAQWHPQLHHGPPRLLDPEPRTGGKPQPVHEAAAEVPPLIRTQARLALG